MQLVSFQSASLSLFGFISDLTVQLLLRANRLIVLSVNSKGLALIVYGVAYAARPNAAWPQARPLCYQQGGTDYLWRN